MDENFTIIETVQIVEEDGYRYEQRNDIGCISRLCIGKIMEDGSVEALPSEITIPTMEERVENLEETIETVFGGVL